MLQYVIMCVFPRSQSKWPPCYVKLPFSFLCSFKILRSTVSERGRAAVLFVGNLLTSNLLHIIRQKSLQLPSNNRYDQMCVLKWVSLKAFAGLLIVGNLVALDSSPLLCTMDVVTWKADTGTENEHGNDNEIKTLTWIELKIWPRIAGLLHTSPIVSFYYVTKCFILWCHQKYLFLLCHRMFVFIMSPNGGGAALYSTVRQLTLLFCAAAARIKSQSQIIIIFLSNHNPK